jgi:hypothetical protein
MIAIFLIFIVTKLGQALRFQGYSGVLFERAKVLIFNGKRKV